MAAQQQVFFKTNLLFMKCARLIAPATETAASKKRSKGTRTMTWASPTTQSLAEGLSYLPRPQKWNRTTWTHPDTHCGTRKEMQQHLFLTEQRRCQPASDSCVRMGERSGLFSWLLFCVHFLENSMGVEGRVMIMIFPKWEHKLNRYSKILKEMVTG